MATQEKVKQIDSSLFEEFARVELELMVAAEIQYKLNQASIWVFNAWCETDALLDRDEWSSIIESLENQAIKTDDTNILVDEHVTRLRAHKRSLTMRLKSKIHSPEMKAAKAKIDDLVSAQTTLIAENILEAKEAEQKPQLKVVKPKKSKTSLSLVQ